MPSFISVKSSKTHFAAKKNFTEKPILKMTSKNYEFTTTEEMENFEDGDTAMELTGFVDAIEGMKQVKTHQGRVFKFVLNNASNKRMRVVHWGGDALKYHEQVTMYQIMSLSIGTIRDMNVKFPLPPGDNFVLTEFHVQTASTVQCHGTYKEKESLDEFQEVSLSSITSVTGRICTEVYIRTPFKSIVTASEVQALGLTVDEKFKLSVGIINFTPNEDLQPGVCVKIFGVLQKNKMGGQFFKVDDMKSIRIVPGKTMSVSDMKKIAVSATSKRRSEGSLPPSKKNKENEHDNSIDSAKECQQNALRNNIDKDKME